MGSETEKRPLYLIAMDMDIAANVFRNIHNSIDWTAVTIDDSSRFATTASVRKQVAQQIKDAKDGIARLENIENKLRELEKTENVKG